VSSRLLVGGSGNNSPASASTSHSLFPSSSRVASPVGLQVAKIVVLLAIGGLMLYALCESFLFARPHHAHVARWSASDVPKSLASTPAARSELPWWVAKVRSLHSDMAARADTTRLLLLGDSITQG